MEVSKVVAVDHADMFCWFTDCSTNRSLIDLSIDYMGIRSHVIYLLFVLCGARRKNRMQIITQREVGKIKRRPSSKAVNIF